MDLGPLHEGFNVLNELRDGTACEADPWQHKGIVTGKRPQGNERRENPVGLKFHSLGGKRRGCASSKSPLEDDGEGQPE